MCRRDQRKQIAQNKSIIVPYRIQVVGCFYESLAHRSGDMMMQHLYYHLTPQLAGHSVKTRVFLPEL